MDNENNDPELIRLQMHETRAALQDKLETLEQQVKDTVQDAADAASETVQTVKEAVADTVETVKDTVHETVASVKQSLDVAQHVREHPWLMVLAATGLGFAAGKLFSSAFGAEATPAADARKAAGPSAPPHHRHNGKSHARRPERLGFWERIVKNYGDELAKLEGLAIGAVGAVVREMVTSSAPPALNEQITEIMNDMTSKLGGTPIRGPLFETKSTAATPHHQEEIDSKLN